MESLIGGGSKLFAYKNKYKDRSFMGFRPQIGLLSLKPLPVLAFNHPHNLSLSVNHQKLLALPLSSSHTQVELEKVELEKDELQLREMQITDINQTKTVHVKIQLEKECSFGQTFHIVGDDPMFGLWDPEFAVSMNWSDGHVWSLELDIPVGKKINYKFIMKQGTEIVSWQPGPNRVLETWETEKMITICEDWENAEYQKIIEGIPLSYDQLENNQERLIDAEYFVAEPPIILENVDQIVAQGGLVLENNGKAVDIKSFSSLTSQPKSILVEDEEVPVLVPGLTFPTGHVDEELKIEAEKDPAVDAGKATDLNLPELDLKEDGNKNNWRNAQERVDDVLFNDKKQLYENENEQIEMQQLAVQESSVKNLLHVFSDDFQWGRRILDKFLKSFGIL